MSGEKILVADDDRQSRVSIKGALRAAGYEVRGVATAQAAIRAVKRELLSAVVLDATFPDATGLVVLAELRRLAPALPVVMISAHAYIDSAVEAMKAGAADFLQKPIEPQILKSAVANALLPAPAERAPVDYDACIDTARRAIRARVYETAIRHLKLAVGEEPDRPEAFNLLGVALARSGQPLRGQDFFRVALALAPTYAAAQQNLAVDDVTHRFVLGDEAPAP